MNKIKRVLSVALCALLMVSMLATCQFSFTFAATEGDYTYTVAVDDTATVTGYKGTATIIAIPSALNGHIVTAIADKAFRDSKVITEITLPDTVTAIGDAAFQGCSVLSKITLPATLQTVGDAAFSDCSSLKELDLAGATVGIGIVKGCSALESLSIASVGAADNGVGYMATLFNGISNPANPGFPATLKTVSVTADASVEANAFIGMKDLETVNWTQTVTTLEESAFADCASLKELNMNIRAEVIGAKAFYGCKALGDITLTDAVAEIGEAAFSGCTALQNISAHNNLNKIGKDAFKGTKWLAQQPQGEVMLADVLYAYTGSADKIVISAAVRSIADSAMEGITAAEIVIPDTVEYIGINVLKNAGVKTLTIPYLGEAADGNSPYICYLFGGDSFTANAIVLPRALTKVIVSDAATIPAQAFAGCAYLTTVVIPATVTEIKDSAFADCAKLATIEYNAASATVAASAFSGTAIKNLKMGETVKTIPTYLTTSNTALTEVTIPVNVESIGSRAFAGCYNLKTVNYNAVNCTNIAEDAFNYCHKLETVKLGNSVATIPANLYSRYGSSELTVLTIPENVTSIASGAFDHCVSLTTLNYNATACVIADDAFENCTKLKTINLGDNVTTIPANLYTGNENIAKIVIPEQVTGIERNAFNGCAALAEITVPETLTSVGANALANTKWLDMQANGAVYLGNIFYTYKGVLPTDITIKTGTVAIAGGALNVSGDLQNVFIPNSVTEFGNNIFGSAVVTITCYSTATAALEYANANGITVNQITCPDSDVYYVIDQQATENAQGTLKQICLLCGQVIASEPYALGDDLSDRWMLTVAPTCTAAGVLTKGNETKDIPATRHLNTIWKQTKAPTCIAEGEKAEFCLDCNTRLTGVDTIATVDHTAGKWQVIRLPRTYCTGYNAVLCTVCGATMQSKTLPKLEVGNPLESILDVQESDWYYDTVIFAMANGFFTGVDANNFAPKDTMTRAMFVTVIGRLAGVEVNKNVNTAFKDVKKNKYYTGYVKWAADNGIVNGVSKTEFAPDAAITREQICAMIVRYCDYAKIDLKATKKAEIFRDADEISNYALNSVLLCQKAGLVQGRGNRYFQPKATATRAEVAQIIMNLCMGYLTAE